MVAFVLQNWDCDGISKDKRKRTAALDETIDALRSIIAGDDTIEPRSARYVLCLMNSSGTGKTTTVIDAAFACNCLHLHIDLRQFGDIVRISGMCSSFFVHPNSSEYLARHDVIEGFTRLYRDELAHLFSACLVAIKSGGLPSRTVRPLRISNPNADIDEATIAWTALVGSIEPGERVVFHFDECQAVFGNSEKVEYPQNGDLSLGHATDEFSKTEAPRLALASLMNALEPFISITRKFAWVFTGRRANLAAFLNVPAKLSCYDVGGNMEDFSAADVYEVFDKYTGIGIPYDHQEDDVKRFFQRLVGPPRVIECFLNSLVALRISDLTTMVSRREDIMKYIAERFCSEFMPGLKELEDKPGVYRTSAEALKFCCIAPLLKLNLMNVSLRRTYWSDLVANGVLRVDLAGSTQSGGVRLGDSVDFVERNCDPVPAYPILQRILCTKTNTPTVLVDILSRLIDSENNNQNWGGKTCEIALLATLAKPRVNEVTAFLSQMGISECLPASSRVEYSKFIRLDIKGDEVVSSWDPSKHECGADLVFEATLDSASGIVENEIASATIQVTYAKSKSVSKLMRNVTGMVQRALELHAATIHTGRPKRTIIVVASARMQLTSEIITKCCSRLAGATYAPFELNTRLPKSDGVTIDSKWVPHRPYALFFVGPGNDIWRRLIVPVMDIVADNKVKMRTAILEKYASGFLAAYRSRSLDSMDTSTHHARSTRSLLKGFLALVIQTLGENHSIVDLMVRHGLTGVCFLVPQVLEHIPTPGFSRANLELIRPLAIFYVKRDGIPFPSDVSVDTASEVVKYIRYWGIVDPDAKIMDACLSRLNRGAMETMTFTDFAECPVALGTKLSVLAVLLSTRSYARTSVQKRVRQYDVDMHDAEVT